MESKKKLIRKMALFAALVLVLGLVVALFASIITRERRAQRLEERRQQRAEAVERARSDLAELAGRISAVPVDPTIVGEIQAEYFAEVPRGRRFVWGMGTGGEFLFGVPREDFARLNAAWDAHEASIVAEGVFIDRQDFLLRLIHVSDDLDPSDLAPNPDDPQDTPWAELRRYGDRDDWRVFSVPLSTSDGSALGNLYLKMEIVGRDEEWWTEQRPGEDVVAAAAGVSTLAGLFLWFLLPTWVYVDARERGVRRPMLWSFLVLISAVVGLVVYVIARPEVTTLKCPGCEREVNGGAYCPHCGHDLATAFCATCRYPLKPDWAFCPSCRTEIRGSTKATTTPAEGAPTPAEDG
jgi:hypothetical protein